MYAMIPMWILWSLCVYFDSYMCILHAMTSMCILWSLCVYIYIWYLCVYYKQYLCVYYNLYMNATISMCILWSLYAYFNLYDKNQLSGLISNDSKNLFCDKWYPAPGTIGCMAHYWKYSLFRNVLGRHDIQHNDTHHNDT